MNDLDTKWENMLTTQSIFDRYEKVGARFPDVKARETSLGIMSLLDIADQVDAIVFDAFGVLNVGETMISGADERLDQQRARGCAIHILKNVAATIAAVLSQNSNVLDCGLKTTKSSSAGKQPLQNLSEEH